MPKKFTPHEQDVLSKLAGAMGNPLDDFDHAVIRHVQEIMADKMRAAQTGGSLELGPTEAQEQAQKQAGTLQQQAATQGAAQAAQAQAQQSPVNAPPAPAGPAGVTQPYPALKAVKPPQTPGQPEEDEQED